MKTLTTRFSNLGHYGIDSFSRSSDTKERKAEKKRGGVSSGASEPRKTKRRKHRFHLLPATGKIECRI